MAPARSTLGSQKTSVHIDSGSESDSDGPESVPLSQAKRHAKEFQTSVASTLAKRKEDKREQNRRRDERLKAQAEERKLREEVELDDEDEESGSQESDLDTRNGEDLDEEEDGEKGVEEDSESDEDFAGIHAASSDAEAEDDQGAVSLEEDDDGPEDTTSPKQPKSNPKHLPDHLFATAFAQTQPIAESSKTAKRKVSDSDDELSSKRRRKRKNAARKDILIGSRTFRSVTEASTIGAGPGSSSRLLPPAKARQFVDRSLALKAAPPVVTVSGSSKPPNRNDRARSWQRRPANIGVLRPSIHGPAASFVRSG